MLIQLNTTISSLSYETMSSQISQTDAIESGKILEFDLYKIGYKVQTEKIKIADSTTIKFLSDIDNDNTLDSIRYFVGNKYDMSNTPNPNDIPFYRKVNNNQPEMIGAATEFNLAYFDSSGMQLNYGSLSNVAGRKKIRSIRTLIRFEAAEPQDSVYQGVDFLRIIRPKNLNF